MGKSPGKWIKTLLFGKKSSKTNFSKGREKEVWVSAKATEADLDLDPPLASDLALNPIDENEEKIEETGTTANLPLEGAISLQGNRYADALETTQLDVPKDPERIRQEQAATKVQAAFRGYLALRAFWALKGIIRLQALVRGHLVRRQAVSTLRCMLGIVKLQAIARGRKIRHSDIGLEVQKKCILVKPLESKHVDPVGVFTSARLAKLSANAFVCKLLASLSTAMPLHLQYDSTEPNSVLNWLECWSASLLFKPVPKPKKVSGSKSQKKQGNSQTADTETGRQKHSSRRIPALGVDISTQSSIDFEKPRRNLRKASSHPADSMQEDPQNELEKVKRNLRKVHAPEMEGNVQPEVDSEKPKCSLGKASRSPDQVVLEQCMSDCAEKMKEKTVAVSKLPDRETTPEPLVVNEAVDLLHDDQTAVELQPLENRAKDESLPVTNGESSPREDLTGGENQKSIRKAASSAKQERSENGLQIKPSLPSYMAATESAKAKLRAQDSPRFGQDPEKHNVTRRHSLPSSTNSKMSSLSPRAHRSMNASCKGGNRSDRSLFSSRDGNARVIQAEWRR